MLHACWWDTVTSVTSPQDPWQQGGYSQYPSQGGYPQYPQSGSYPQYPQGNQYQGNQYPVNQYPGGQYQQGGPYAQTPAIAGYPRPATIGVAFWIAILAPIVATVLGALNFLFLQSWASNAINATGGDPGDPDIQSVQHAASIGVIVLGGVATFFSLVLTLLWILFAFQMRAGRNWARVVLTIFASIWCLSAIYILITAARGGLGGLELPADVQPPTSVAIISFALGAMGLISMAMFIVLVFLKPSNWYFQANRFR